MAAAVMAAHPEYHALLDAPARHLEREYLPEQGKTNPFLHLSMHLAVREQLSIDQPQGVAAHYRRLLARTGSERSEEHTSELQSPKDLVCRLLLEKKKK